MSQDVYLEAFILRGKNRRQVLKCLKYGRKTQAQIHKETGLYRTHVRRVLLELIHKKLVKCLNPKDRIYKLYELTSTGRKYLANIS